MVDRELEALKHMARLQSAAQAKSVERRRSKRGPTEDSLENRIASKTFLVYSSEPGGRKTYFDFITVQIRLIGDKEKRRETVQLYKADLDKIAKERIEQSAPWRHSGLPWGALKLYDLYISHDGVLTYKFEVKRTGLYAEKSAPRQIDRK